jgi:dimethylhistidine N-methyltransferase
MSHGTDSSPAEPRLLQLHRRDPALQRDELQHGLLASAASVAPKHLYDRLGSRLFDAITELPEYYPTRTEAGILEACAPQVAARVPPGTTLVDLGAGNCCKAARLFGLLEPSRYVAVDISVDHLQQSLQALQREHPRIAMLGIGLDFSARLVLPDAVGPGPRLLFYPGSSIGNFTPEQALDFLGQVREQSQGGHLLIGVDLVKPASVLVPAYDDELGVTAAFNLNLLNHVNAQLGSDFRPRDWRHVALFDEAHSRIEMHLEARAPVRVRWPGGERRFQAGERIHTENSYKYERAGFESLLQRAGFSDLACWTDARGWFAIFVARA